MAYKGLKTAPSGKSTSAAPAATGATAPARQFAQKAKKPKKNDFDTLVDSAGFVLTMGMLITATGLILLKGFHNRFSMYVLDLGIILCLYALGMKLLDIILKIIGVRP